MSTLDTALTLVRLGDSRGYALLLDLIDAAQLELS